MRLWSLHPSYLDRIGLIACWREALLAQNVLWGKTNGYKHHPQLERFDTESISIYLCHLYNEARQRGYNFDDSKILGPKQSSPIPVTNGQLEYEAKLLKQKLAERNSQGRMILESEIISNKLFYIVEGPIERWERVRGQIKSDLL